MTKNRDKSLILCTQCIIEKEVEQFYGDSLQCKKCHSNNVQVKLESKIRNFLEICIERNLIQFNEQEAARLLVMSCKSRFEACKYNKKGYQGVECNYPDFYTFFFDVIKIEGFWNNWKKISAIHTKLGTNSSRPTIDRINPLGNYTLDNIQALPMEENVLKGSQKACIAIIVTDKSISSLSKFEFDSKKEFTEKLSKYFPAKILKNIRLDTGNVQQIDNTYSIILQSKNIDKNNLGKGINNTRYRLVIEWSLQYVDLDAMKFVKVKQLGSYETLINRIIIK